MYICTYILHIQLLKLGFADDLNQNEINALIQCIVDLRNPTKITRGLSAPLPAPQTGADPSPCHQIMASSTSRNRVTKSRGTVTLVCIIIRMYVCTLYVCMYYVCMYACMYYTCMYTMYMYMYVCMYMYMYVTSFTKFVSH